MQLRSSTSANQYIKNWLVRKYGTLRRVLPNRYFVFRFDGGRIYLNLKEHLGMFRRALGVYEPGKMDAVQRLLKPGSTFVDVGGNNGFFALLAANVVGDSGKVLCFEPEPNNFEWIQRNVKLNGYRNIGSFPLALSDSDGEATLYLSSRSGYHSLIGGLAYRDRGTITIPKRTLDGFLQEIGQNQVDMIKIDVEGAELQVLKGARRTLERNPNIILLVELHPQLGVNPKEVYDFLCQRGFGIYQMAFPFDVPLPVHDKLDEFLARLPPNSGLEEQL